MQNANDEIKRLENIAYNIRCELIRLASKVTIHIGGDLSATDILTVLWQHVMHYDKDNPNWEERDRFILSKGHCAVAVSFNQAYLGYFSTEDIYAEYDTDNGRFSMSPCRHVNPFFETSATGSLGQGLPIAVGIAKALKLKGNNKSYVYVLLGDGELQEGSNWEAAMLAGHIGLDNLVAIVDNNNLQFDGSTDQIVRVNNIGEKFTPFGWKTYEVDGHNIEDLVKLLDMVRVSDKPVLIDAHTIKGKGVDYMENNYAWHAGMVKPEELDITLQALNKRYNNGII
jgi:transketolase